MQDAEKIVCTNQICDEFETGPRLAVCVLLEFDMWDKNEGADQLIDTNECMVGVTHPAYCPRRRDDAIPLFFILHCARDLKISSSIKLHRAP
jgi:hypothetical protein